MSTRARQGHLEIPDTFDRDRSLTIEQGAGTITLLAVDWDMNQCVRVTLGTAELDELAAEILRLRDQLDI